MTDPSTGTESEQHATAPGRPKMTGRQLAAVGGRFAVGIVGLAVASAAVVAASLAPVAPGGAPPPSLMVTPVPTGQLLQCPGAVLRLADEAGEGATAASAIGAAAVAFAANAGDVAAEPLDASDASNGGTASAPLVLALPPAVDHPEVALLAGAQSQLVQSGEFAGLAASACAVPSSDAWLVGGSTAVGRTTLVTLSNPSSVAATVDLSIFGEGGAVQAAGTSGIIVAGSSQVVLPLAGFAPNLQSPVVRVQSRGGQVVANLQQSTVRGLDPGGVDIIEPASSPATSIVIPGLVMTDAVALEELLGGETSEDWLTAVRVFVPGENGAHATVSLVPEDGQDTGTSFAIEFEPGVVSEIPMPEVADGSYTVTIEAEEPVVAGVRVSSAGADGTDFSWRAAGQELDGPTLVTVAPGDGARIHLANPAAADQQVTLTPLDGQPVTVIVPAGSSAVAGVQPGATYLLDGFERLYGGVSFAGGGFIAGYGLQAPPAASAPVKIYP